MSGELDELAATAAAVLVSALAGDSWADAQQWFAAAIGHEGRLAATRAELASAGGGPARELTVQAQVRAWTVRLRDVFEDSPAAARTLQDLVTGMRAQGLLQPPAASSPPPAPATAPYTAAPYPGAPYPGAPYPGAPYTAAPSATVPQSVPMTSGAPPPAFREAGLAPVPPGEPPVAPLQSRYAPPGPPPAAGQGLPGSFGPVAAAGRPAKGKARGLITGISVVVVVVAVLVSWQAGLFRGASPQLRPLGWTGAQAPLPGYAAALTSDTVYDALYGVSCPATGTCLAVGVVNPRHVSGSSLLVERLSSGRWTPEQSPPPLPAAADSTGLAYLNDIVCSSPSACTAVGVYTPRIAGGNANDSNGLVETLSGATWTAASVPLPADAGQNKQVTLISLACPAAVGCIAVGSNRDLGADGNLVGGGPLIATQNGGTWTSIEAPLPPDAAATGQDAQLQFITCTGPGSCAAVGWYSDKKGNQQGLIETMANGTWTAARAPLPANAAAKPTVELWSVSCASGTCVAVGDYQTGSGSSSEKALIETLPNGTAKSASARSLPLPESESALNAVYCVSASSCLALGGYGSGGLLSGLAATLTDGTWSTTPVPLPANATTSAKSQDVLLWGVACPTTASCEMVGSYTADSGATVPLIATGSG